MAGKRGATTDLNHDNWDQEDIPEERGTFKVASENELKNRKIATARRKLATSTTTDSTDAPPPKRLLEAFAGFTKPIVSSAAATSSSTASPFAFLSKISNTTNVVSSSSSSSASNNNNGNNVDSKVNNSTNAGGSKTLSLGGDTQNSTTKLLSFGGLTNSDNTGKTTVTTIAANNEANKSESSNKTYCTELASLNLDFCNWIKAKVDENPVCILLPILREYEKYFEKLEKLKEESTAGKAKDNSKSVNDVGGSSAPFKFGLPATTTAVATSVTTSSSPGIFSSSSVAPAVTKSINSNSSFTFGFTKSNTNSPIASKPESGVSENASSLTKSSSTKSDEPVNKPTGFVFGSSTNSIFGNKNEKSSLGIGSGNGFSFGISKSPSNADKPGGSQKITPSTSASDTKFNAPSGFSFLTAGNNASSPFNFKMPTPSAIASEATSSKNKDNATNADAENEDGEDEPPKVEFKQVVEEDAVYSKRCKVFVKKDKSFADRGVGTLYLKPIKESGKTQMIVRADTNLGNILVNLVLADGLPTQRTGANNVMMVAPITPDVPKPVTMLLRVKSGTDADELLAEIEKHKK